MRKTINKIFTGIIGLVASICMTLGFVCMEKQQPTFARAEMVASTMWTAPYHPLTAQEDTETGYAHLPISNYGERMYYNEKLTLDGLTVTIGSTNMVAGSRFGFGFVTQQAGYSPISTDSEGNPQYGGIFNVTVVPSWTSGQDCVFFNSTHADGTIVYTYPVTTPPTSGVCSVDGGVQNRFISAPSAETRYSITFKDMGRKRGTFCAR